MRKIFLIVLCCCLYSMFSYAGQTTDCGDVGTNNSCIVGCYFYGATGKCTLCGEGTYKNTAGSGECSNCIKPTDAEFLTGLAYLGFTTNTCPWTVTCQSGQYFNPYAENDAGSFKCVSCGDGYSGTGTDCTVKGSGNTDNGNCSFEKVCVPNVYTLDLQKNTLLTTWFDKKYENKTAYAKYGEGFAMSQAPAEWSDTLPNDALQPNRPVKQFLGYYTEKKCGGTGVFNFNGAMSIEWNALGNLVDDSTNGLTLYACWNNQDVTVAYYKPDDSVYKYQTCSVDDSQESGSSCMAQEYAGGAPEGENGQLFEYYKCTYGDGTVCNPATLKVGDAIPLGQLVVNLKPVFKSCPAGYYCVEGVQNKCPIGSTSTSGADDISDCYMSAGSSGTKFCDNNDCFYLPGTGTIEYNP